MRMFTFRDDDDAFLMGKNLTIIMKILKQSLF